MFATSFLFLDCGFIIPQDKAFFCDEVTLIKKIWCFLSTGFYSLSKNPPGFSDKRLAVCGRQTLRGFFDTLSGCNEKPLHPLFYFSAGRKKLFDPLKLSNINRCASVSGAYACCSFSSAAPAAACSASFLLWPVPVENTSPFSSTAASKTLAWSGPVEPTSR